jgi:hypothetical protein
MNERRLTSVGTSGRASEDLCGVPGRDERRRLKFEARLEARLAPIEELISRLGLDRRDARPTSFGTTLPRYSTGERVAFQTLDHPILRRRMNETSENPGALVVDLLDSV